MTTVEEFVAGNWQADVACRGQDTDLFYVERGGDCSEALRFCERCPVITQCRGWAIAHEIVGIWGGTTGRQRRNIRRRSGITINTPESWVQPTDPDPAELEDGTRSAADIAGALDVSTRTVIRRRAITRREEIS